jgi:hypothetical protein
MTVIDARVPGTALFVGLAADEPIYTVTWTAIGGGQINTGIDNLYTGTIPAPGQFSSAPLGRAL